MLSLELRKSLSEGTARIVEAKGLGDNETHTVAYHIPHNSCLETVNLPGLSGDGALMIAGAVGRSASVRSLCVAKARGLPLRKFMEDLAPNDSLVKLDFGPTLDLSVGETSFPDTISAALMDRPRKNLLHVSAADHRLQAYCEENHRCAEELIGAMGINASVAYLQSLGSHFLKELSERQGAVEQVVREMPVDEELRAHFLANMRQALLESKIPNPFAQPEERLKPNQRIIKEVVEGTIKWTNDFPRY